MTDYYCDDCGSTLYGVHLTYCQKQYRRVGSVIPIGGTGRVVYPENFKVGQSRKMSLVESMANIAIGYAINMVANFLIFPIFGFHLTLRDNFLMGLFYTAISILRSYTLRRIFNAIHRR